MAETRIMKKAARQREGGKDVLGRAPGHVVAEEDRKPIVTAWSGMQDYVNCPPDYGTWFKQYLTYTRYLVSQFNIPPSDVEDVVSEIMIRFMERDSLGEFVPTWKTQSKTGRSNFRSYYSRFIVDYAPGKNRNVRRHASRNLLLCDATTDEDGSQTWLDAHAQTETFETAAMEEMAFEALVASLRQKVDPELASTVDAVVALALTGPSVRIAALAERMNCSQRIARQRFAAVRGVLSELVGVS